jgi:hypothetical protein
MSHNITSPRRGEATIVARHDYPSCDLRITTKPTRSNCLAPGTPR